MEANPNCPKCHASAVYRNGKVLGKQRYRCKECGFQFTRTTPRGRPAHEKALAVTLYTMGLSLSAIARLFHVSTPAVLRWVRNFAERVYEKPEPGEVVIVELDEMWHFLTSTKTNFGSGKRIVVIPVNSSTGNVAGVIRLLSTD